MGEGRGFGKPVPVQRIAFYGSTQFQLRQSFADSTSTSSPLNASNKLLLSDNIENITMIDSLQLITHQSRAREPIDYEIIILDLLPYFIRKLKKNGTSTMASFINEGSKFIRTQLLHHIKDQYNNMSNDIHKKGKLKIKYIGCEGEEILWDYLRNKQNVDTITTGIFLLHPSCSFISSKKKITNKINSLIQRIKEGFLIKLFLIIDPEMESAKKLSKIQSIKNFNPPTFPKEHTQNVYLNFNPDSSSSPSPSSSSSSTSSMTNSLSHENRKEIQERIISFYFQKINHSGEGEQEQQAGLAVEEGMRCKEQGREGDAEIAIELLLPSQHNSSYLLPHTFILKKEEIEFLKKYSICPAKKKQKNSEGVQFDDQFLLLQKISRDSCLFHFFYQEIVSELLSKYKYSANLLVKGHSMDFHDKRNHQQIINWKNEDFLYFLDTFSRAGIEYLYMDRINDTLFTEFKLDHVFRSTDVKISSKFRKMLNKSTIKGIRVHRNITAFSLKQLIGELLQNQLFCKLELLNCRKLKTSDLKPLYPLLKSLSSLKIKDCHSLRFGDLVLSKFNFFKLEKFEYLPSNKDHGKYDPSHFETIRRFLSRKNLRLKSAQLPNEFFNFKILEDIMGNPNINLISLNLSSCTNIHDFLCLTKLKCLEELNLSRSGIFSQHLEDLAKNFSTLVRLNISFCTLTRKTVSNFIKHNKNLRELQVDITEDKSLIYSEYINDSLSQSLNDLQSIRFLSVRNARIDSSLMSELIMYCPNLKYIDFTGCSFVNKDSLENDDTIIMNFVEARKNVVVYYPPIFPNTTKPFIPSLLYPSSKLVSYHKSSYLP